MNIFSKAADVLIEGGHCKSKLEAGTAHCGIGALLVAEYGTVFPGGHEWARPDTAFGKARGLLKDLYPHGFVDWNNAPERTGEDVVRLFKELAAKMDADIGEENPKIVEFEPIPETAPEPSAPAPAPAEPVPA
jgi:hypothetical protein